MEALNQIREHLIGQGTRCCPASNASTKDRIYGLGLQALQLAPGVLILSRWTPRATYLAAIGEGIAHFTLWPALEAKKKIAVGHRRAHMIHEALMWSFMVTAFKHMRADRWSLMIPLDLAMVLQMRYSSYKLLGIYTQALSKTGGAGEPTQEV